MGWWGLVGEGICRQVRSRSEIVNAVLRREDAGWKEGWR